MTPPPPAQPTPAGPGRNAGPAGGARNSRFQGAPRQAAVASSASSAPVPPQQGSGPAAGVRHAYGPDDKAGAPPRSGGGGGGTPPPKIRPAAPGKGGPPVRRILIGAGMVVLLGAAVYAWSLSVGHDTATNASGPTVVPPEGNCVVSYAVWADDQSRFKAQVTVANRDVAPIANWSLWFLMNGDQVVSSNINAGKNVPASYSKLRLKQQGKEVTVISGGTLSSQQTETIPLAGQYTESNAAPLAFKLNGKTCETFVSSKPGQPSRQVEHLSNGTTRLGPVPTSKTPVPGITIGSNGIAVVKPTTKPTTSTPPGGGGGPTVEPSKSEAPVAEPPTATQETTDPVVEPSSESPAPPSTLPSDNPACGTDPVDCEPLGP
jgi:serine/threonine-protein kinase